MSRPLAQLLPPSELPGGAGAAQLGAPNGTSSGPPGGHLTSMNNLKSLLQLPIKADQRGGKDCCEIKGEHKARERAGTTRARVRASPHSLF